MDPKPRAGLREGDGWVVNPMIGFLNIDKPRGMTSTDVVRRVKRAARMRRGVGHGGTLDPIATGVLIIGVGKATRLMDRLLGGSKEYVAEIEFGVSTDTYDADGEVVSERDASGVERDDVETALAAFAGEIEQTPPMYSALKRDGKRLYELARQGIEVERKPRTVVVHEIALADWQPPIATVKVVCGSGFYVRSLAHDLGEALGCGGHMRALVRRRAGPFRIEDALSLEDALSRISVLADSDDSAADSPLTPPDFALGDLRAMTVPARDARTIRNGGPLPPGAGLSPEMPDERARVYDADGAFIAIARFDDGMRRWRPEKVFGG